MALTGPHFGQHFFRRGIQRQLTDGVADGDFTVCPRAAGFQAGNCRRQLFGGDAHLCGGLFWNVLWGLFVFEHGLNARG